MRSRKIVPVVGHVLYEIVMNETENTVVMDISGLEKKN